MWEWTLRVTFLESCLWKVFFGSHSRLVRMSLLIFGRQRGCHSCKKKCRSFLLRGASHLRGDCLPRCRCTMCIMTTLLCICAFIPTLLVSLPELWGANGGLALCASDSIGFGIILLRSFCYLFNSRHSCVNLSFRIFKAVNNGYRLLSSLIHIVASHVILNLVPYLRSHIFIYSSISFIRCPLRVLFDSRHPS